MMIAGAAALWWKRRMIGGIFTGEDTTTSIDSLIYFLENGPTGRAFLTDPGPLDQAERQEWINALNETKGYEKSIGIAPTEPVNYLLDDFWPRLSRVLIVETDMGLKIDREGSLK